VLLINDNELHEGIDKKYSVVTLIDEYEQLEKEMAPVELTDEKYPEVILIEECVLFMNNKELHEGIHMKYPDETLMEEKEQEDIERGPLPLKYETFPLGILRTPY
jgi:hypothetical protein